VINEHFTLQSYFGKETEIKNWLINGLPDNRLAIENALIIMNSDKLPLIYDPNEDAAKWLCEITKAAKLIKSEYGETGLLSKISTLLIKGGLFIVENVDQD
jgi:dynein heavy chain